MAKALEGYSVRSPQSNSIVPAHATIVQCPSCRTRFAVEKRSITELEFPRFHCSRCDHVFSLAEGGVVAEPSQPYIEKALDQLDSAARRAQHSAFSLGLQVPRDFQAERPSSAPHESLSVGSEESDGQFTFGFNPNTASHSRSAEDPNSSLDWVKLPDEDKQPSKPSTSARQLFDRDLPNPLPEVLNEHTLELPRNTSLLGWHALLVGVLPILAVLGALALFSFNISPDSSMAKLFSALSFASAPQTAPLGLQIADSKLKLLTLDNGEDIQLVSGTLENNTPNDFKDVQIEAVLFDQSGRAVRSVLGSLASGLAQSRIRSLSTEMINTLQSEPRNKGLALKSGASIDFAVAITDSAAANTPAEFYSVRIYSVQ